MIGKLREIINELLRQLLRGHIIFRAVGPCRTRVKNAAVDAWHSNRKFKAKIWILTEFGIVQAAIQRRVQKRARRLDRHAADAGHRCLATGPAGVDQPALDVTLGNALFQQIAIDARVTRHEWRAKAGGECRLRLRHANFGPGNTRGIARKKVVHRLIGR